MRKLVFLMSGLALGLGYLLLAKPKYVPAPGRLQAPVDDLAHKLQDAWRDHHTVA